MQQTVETYKGRRRYRRGVERAARQGLYVQTVTESSRWSLWLGPFGKVRRFTVIYRAGESA